MTKTNSLLRSGARRIIHVTAVLVASIATRPSFAEDWRAYSPLSASAPALVLEAVNSGRAPEQWSRSASRLEQPTRSGSLSPLARERGTGGQRGPASRTPLFAEIKPEAVLKGQIKTLHVLKQRHFPGHRARGHGLHPGAIRRLQARLRLCQNRRFTTPRKALLEDADRHEGDARDHRRVCQAGRFAAPMKNTLGRRNRCFEYDGMGDNNVRFLVEELLPFVAKQFDLNLSTSGNDRCIAGGSSGGIAAFNAAWERPEAFSRVYANSGSFVAFRGGHEFPTLVRKFEAKPIRAYLTTGTRDMENCAGDWFLLDQEMDKALKFSGYDYRSASSTAGTWPVTTTIFRKRWASSGKTGPTGSSRAECPARAGCHSSRRNWQLVAQGRHDAGAERATPAARCFSWMPRRTRSTASIWTAISRNSCPTPVTPAPVLWPGWRALRGFEPDRQDHELRPGGQGSLVVDGLRGHTSSRHTRRRPVCHQQWRQAGRLRRRLVCQGRQENAGRHRAEVRHRPGLSARPVAALRGRRTIQNGSIAIRSTPTARSATRSVSSGCTFPTGKTTPAPIRSATPWRARCLSRRARASRFARTTAPPR